MAAAPCPPRVLLGHPHTPQAGTAGRPRPRCEVRAQETSSSKVSRGQSRGGWGRHGHHGPAPGQGGRAWLAAGDALRGRGRSGQLHGVIPWPRGRKSFRPGPAEQCAVCAAAVGAHHPAHGEEVAAGSRPARGTRPWAAPQPLALAQGRPVPCNQAPGTAPGCGKGTAGAPMLGTRTLEGSPTMAMTTGLGHSRAELVMPPPPTANSWGALAQGDKCLARPARCPWGHLCPSAPGCHPCP